MLASAPDFASVPRCRKEQRSSAPSATRRIGADAFSRIDSGASHTSGASLMKQWHTE